MKRLHFQPNRLMVGALILASPLCLLGCAPSATRLASAEPSVCGGDFGMLEQMEYEYRGNPKPVSPDVYEHC